MEVPIPAPKKDEILLRIEAISLNAMDSKIQKGVARPILPRKFPHIPGTEFVTAYSVCSLFARAYSKHMRSKSISVFTIGQVTTVLNSMAYILEPK